MKSTIKNNHVAPHPELTSTLSCKAALCGSQGLIQALQAPRPGQGRPRTSGRAGASPLPTKVWFFLCIVSFLCVAVRCSPPTTHQAILCCSATLYLLKRLFCSSKPRMKRKMRWCDTQKLPLRLPKWQGPYDDQVSSSQEDPGNVSWVVVAVAVAAAAAHLQLLCIWPVLKHLVVITQI